MEAAQRGLDPGPVHPTGQDWWSRAEAERLWRDHGRAAYSLACALLGDEAVAKRAVVLGMTDFARSHVGASGAGTRRSLARHVYRRSTELASATTRASALSPTMAGITQLARIQRACLALCAFGGHSYADAAELVDIAPLTAAQLVTSGLYDLRARVGSVAVQALVDAPPARGTLGAAS